MSKILKILLILLILLIPTISFCEKIEGLHLNPRTTEEQISTNQLPSNEDNIENSKNNEVINNKIINNLKENQRRNDESYKNLQDKIKKMEIYPKNDCARKEINGLIKFLNDRVGMLDGPSQRIIGIKDMMVMNKSSNALNHITCHGSIIFDNGKAESGIVDVIDPGEKEPLKLTWKSDTNIEKEYKKQKDEQWKKSWRSFRGDIASWSGIPPFPPSTSENQSKIATTHCTVADAADHMVSIWASNNDCKNWIKHAETLAKSGPTPIQIYDYKIHKCIERLSIVAEPATSSGEYYMLCAHSIPYSQ